MAIRSSQLQILMVLDALLAEGSVTAAARRLNLTQPAVSQTLARARTLFDDSLFVRANGRMVPTERASALSVKLNAWMEATRDVLEPPRFDPETQSKNFVIASNDFAEQALLPPLVSAVKRAAPHVTLALRSVESARLLGDDVREGRVHLVISGIAPPPFFIERMLYEEHFVLLARRGHPVLDGAVTAEQFAAMDHALVSPQGIGLRGPIDDALADLGLSRRVSLSVSRFASLPPLLRGTDLIAAVPSRFADTMEARAFCGSAALPFPAPTFGMRLSWHQRFTSDPAHRWLRDLAFDQIESASRRLET